MNPQTEIDALRDKVKELEKRIQSKEERIFDLERVLHLRMPKEPEQKIPESLW